MSDNHSTATTRHWAPRLIVPLAIVVAGLGGTVAVERLTTLDPWVSQVPAQTALMLASYAVGAQRRDCRCHCAEVVDDDLAPLEVNRYGVLPVASSPKSEPPATEIAAIPDFDDTDVNAEWTVDLARRLTDRIPVKVLIARVEAERATEATRVIPAACGEDTGQWRVES